MSDELAARFEQDRPHLTAVARRILGTTGEADDAVQEAWLRLHRSDSSEIDNLSGWLTTVVSRVCLDVLRARSTRDAVAERVPEPVAPVDPAEGAVVGDAVGAAMLVVLDTLTPDERLAFVMHDVFGAPFAQIAEVIGCSTEAARQHASRARRRVRGSDPDDVVPDPVRQRVVVEAFVAASKSGDFAGLLAVLAPDVVARSDAAATAMGSDVDGSGAQRVAELFVGRAKAARLVTLDGLAGAVWQHRGEVKVAFCFRVEDDLVTAIELVADAERLAAIEVGPL